MNQVILKVQADGNNWNYWAEEADAVEQSTPNVVKDFTEQYVLPYMVYYKYETSGASIRVYLNDGSYFSLEKGGCIDFLFDTNGDKKPNKTGRDRFYFLYCTESHPSREHGKLIPYLVKGETREQALENCKSKSSACSGLLVIDGWQFKDDYPYHI